MGETGGGSRLGVALMQHKTFFIKQLWTFFANYRQCWVIMSTEKWLRQEMRRWNRNIILISEKTPFTYAYYTFYNR